MDKNIDTKRLETATIQYNSVVMTFINKIYLYSQIKFRCDNYIDPQYYNPNASTRGGKIFTVEICAIFFENDDIFSQDEIRNNENIGGK